MKEELLKLAERCEQATGPDRELDALIFAALNPTRLPAKNIPNTFVDGERFVGTVYITKHTRSVPRYTASLDAAMTLVPEGLDWFRERGALVPFIISVDGPTCRYISECDNSLILALCAAALRARASL